MIILHNKQKNTSENLRFTGDLYIELYEEGEYDESLVYDIIDKCDAMTTGIVYENEEIKVEICE